MVVQVPVGGGVGCRVRGVGGGVGGWHGVGEARAHG